MARDAIEGMDQLAQRGLAFEWRCVGEETGECGPGQGGQENGHRQSEADQETAGDVRGLRGEGRLQTLRYPPARQAIDLISETPR